MWPAVAPRPAADGLAFPSPRPDRPRAPVIPDHAYQTALDCFRRAESVVLTTHVKPDADGLGSAFALARWLRAAGKAVRLVVPTAPPEKYAFLDRGGRLEVAGRDVEVPAIPQPDLVAIVDTCTWQQLEGMEPLVAESGAEVLVIDHHRTRDALATVELIDPDAAATVVLVHRLLVRAGAIIDADTATDLFVGLAGDTDWFRLPNVEADTLRLAGDLAEAGASPWDIHARLNLSDSLSKLRLWGLAVATLRPALDGRVTVLHVTREMFRDVGAEPGDTENLINVCLQVRGALAGVMLVEADPGEVRVSLRSVPGVNVLQVAERFGGGGHMRAAGARLEGTLREVEARVLDALGPVLADAVTASQTPEIA